MRAKGLSLLLNSPVTILAALLVFVGSAFAESGQILHRFQSTDGTNPMGNLISDRAGNLYGTTEYGGASFYGTVFKLAPPAKMGLPWTLTTLYSFTNSGDGARPTDGLVFDSKGNLYGTTSDTNAGGYGEIFQLSPPATKGGAWTETVLYHFTGGADGGTPRGGLVPDEQGNFFGTTYNSVFELSPHAQPGGAWTFTLLHELAGGPTDGKSSQSGLVRDRSGNLYGTTLWGGYQGNPYCGSIGCGTAFEVSPPAALGDPWTEQIIHFFGVGDDGFDPEGGLTLDARGDLYGTTDSGGTQLSGTAFQLTPPSQSGAAWTETVIHSFSYSSYDGAAPMATMILDSAGNLYGTTLFGGNSCYYDYTPYGCGVVFELSPPQSVGGAWREGIIYFFQTGRGTAKQPAAGLLFDHYGNLYGTTAYGGYGSCTVDGANGCGTVFKIVR